MKFICDKCRFCRDSDDHKDIWIGTKISDGYEWRHWCYECGKQVINLIEASEETKNE